MSKITRRSYKRKKIIMGASLFGAIGLVSTGFAAWVLSAPATSDPIATNLHVGEVTDKNMEFKNVKTYLPNTETESADFYFEPAAGDNSGRVRLGGSQSESLGLDVKGEIWKVQNLGNITGIITLSNTDKAKLDEAISKNYIVAPDAYQTEQLVLYADGAAIDTEGKFTFTTGDVPEDPDDPENTNTDSVMYFTYKISFKWGSAFGGKNPSLYFDEEPQYTNIETGKPGDDLSEGTVGAILSDMHSLLDGVALTLTLTANPNQ